MPLKTRGLVLVVAVVLSPLSAWAGGWYLLVPPPTEVRPLSEVLAEGFKPGSLPPLSKWLQFLVFDSAQECSDSRLALVKSAAVEAQRQPSSVSAVMTSHRIDASQCIASDDPRLRGN